MDQLKEYGQVLLKHRFWLLSAIVLIAAILSYRSGANTLSATYESRHRAVKSAFDSMRTVASTPDHPNDAFLAGIGELHEQQKKITLAAWEALYERQREVLRWPEQFRSIEQLPPDAEIDANDRYTYMNYARDQLPRLYDIVKVRRQETVQRADGQSEQVIRGIVEWEESSRKELERLFDWNRQPSTKRVRYTQETLWVYETLLGIIAKVNEGATAFYDAPIQQIIELRIAQAAVGTKQSDVELPQIGAAPSASSSSETTAAVPGPDATDEELGQGRYVDGQGNPIPATQADTAEYKLMPVRMKLVMDQREIPQLLANCANAQLVVEVRRVRINPDENVAEQGGGTSRVGARPQRRTGGDDVENPYNTTVEVYGLIYIYNPPNKQKLGMVDAVAGAPNQPLAPASP